MIQAIYSQKDTTIYEQYTNMNTGVDEVLEIQKIVDGSTIYNSRILVKFPQSEISDVITNKVSGSSFDSYLKMYLANASEIPLDYTIYSYPISGSWNVGTGRLANSPITTDGSSLAY